MQEKVISTLHLALLLQKISNLYSISVFDLIFKIINSSKLKNNLLERWGKYYEIGNLYCFEACGIVNSVLCTIYYRDYCSLVIFTSWISFAFGNQNFFQNTLYQFF